MRTLTKPQEDYFDELRRIGDEPLKTALDALGTLSYENCVDYVKLVYEQGPGIGQNLLGDHIEHPKKAIYRTWWDATVEMGCSVLADSYGDANSFADPSRPFGVALPSFPISELSRTRSLFHQYGSEIGSALLLAALPQAYATSWGARACCNRPSAERQARGPHPEDTSDGSVRHVCARPQRLRCGRRAEQRRH